MTRNNARDDCISRRAPMLSLRHPTSYRLLNLLQNTLLELPLDLLALVVSS